jgi:hypothetical protein
VNAGGMLNTCEFKFIFGYMHFVYKSLLMAYG